MGTSVGNVVISYDVSSKNPEVKEALKKMGYLDYFTVGNPPKYYYLPDTTLWHKEKSSDQAMADMKKVTSDLKVTLEKALAVKASEFVGL